MAACGDGRDGRDGGHGAGSGDGGAAMLSAARAAALASSSRLRRHAARNNTVVGPTPWAGVNVMPATVAPAGAALVASGTARLGAGSGRLRLCRGLAGPSWAGSLGRRLTHKTPTSGRNRGRFRRPGQGWDIRPEAAQRQQRPLGPAGNRRLRRQRVGICLTSRPGKSGLKKANWTDVAPLL